MPREMPQGEKPQPKRMEVSGWKMAKAANTFVSTTWNDVRRKFAEKKRFFGIAVQRNESAQPCNLRSHTSVPVDSFRDLSVWLWDIGERGTDVLIVSKMSSVV
jgi:hypothetical protein